MNFDMKLEAYLLTYWSDSKLFTAKTNVDYCLITAECERTSLGLENMVYAGRSTPIGEVVVPYSVDFVQKNIVDVHLAVRRELAKANVLDLSSGPKIHIFAKIEDLTSLENAVKSACRYLINTYGKGSAPSNTDNNLN